MLEVRDFIEKMKEEVRDYLPDDVYKDVIIDDVEVVKMNDQKLHGLTFRMPGSDAAPTLYVDEMYQAYKDGADIGYLATEMAISRLRWRICIRHQEMRSSRRK